MHAESEMLCGDERPRLSIRRVLVADDSQPLRVAVRRLLADIPNWEICGEAANGREAVEKALELRPDVILMDIGMPELDGLEATRKVLQQLEVEVLVFTQYDSQQAGQEALSAGARGYLPKSRASDLLQALETVAQHQNYFGHHLGASAANGSSC